MNCKRSLASFLLACVGKNDDGPVIMLVSKCLDQVDQVGVLHLLRSEDVSLVQFLHCSRPEKSSKETSSSTAVILQSSEAEADSDSFKRHILYCDDPIKLPS